MVSRLGMQNELVIDRQQVLNVFGDDDIVLLKHSGLGRPNGIELPAPEKSNGQLGPTF
jgi:hypothetical protein